jgi:predicted ATPase
VNLRSISLRREQVPSFDAYPYCIPAVRVLDSLERQAFLREPTCARD